MTQCLKQFVDYFLKHKDEKLFLNFYVLSSSSKWYNISGSAVFAGWLMGLLRWLTTSSTDTISRIFIIILVTFVIGAAGLHHSVVGAVEVLVGMLTSPNIHFTDFLLFMALAVPGNIIGGSIFVAVLKKSHTKEEDFDVQ